MPPNDSTKPAFSDHGDPASSDARKRRMGPVVALLLGLASAAALVSPALWFLPGLGILVSILVLMQQLQNPDMRTGRVMAVAGLILAVLFATWAPTQHYARRWYVQQQSEAVGQQWFGFIFRQQTAKAYGVTRPPKDRGNLDAAYSERVMSDEDARKSYEAFARRKLIRKLLALNGRARPLFHETEKVVTTDDSDVIHNVYEIRYLTDANESESFFVRLVLRRTTHPNKNNGLWQVRHYSSMPNSSSSKTSTAPGVINPPGRGVSP